jgi:hypothetical protein
MREKGNDVEWKPVEPLLYRLIKLWIWVGFLMQSRLRRKNQAVQVGFALDGKNHGARPYFYFSVGGLLSKMLAARNFFAHLPHFAKTFSK